MFTNITKAKFRIVSAGNYADGMMIERLFEEAQEEGGKDEWEPVAEIAVHREVITVHILDTMGTLADLSPYGADTWRLLFDSVREAVDLVRGALGQDGD